MSAIFRHTVHDLRNGRRSWRVLLVLAAPAFSAGLLQVWIG